jgi:hypothetical protein
MRGIGDMVKRGHDKRYEPARFVISNTSLRAKGQIIRTRCDIQSGKIPSRNHGPGYSRVLCFCSGMKRSTSRVLFKAVLYHALSWYLHSKQATLEAHEVYARSALHGPRTNVPPWQSIEVTSPSRDLLCPTRTQPSSDLLVEIHLSRCGFPPIGFRRCTLAIWPTRFPPLTTFFHLPPFLPILLAYISPSPTNSFAFGRCFR